MRMRVLVCLGVAGVHARGCEREGREGRISSTAIVAASWVKIEREGRFYTFGGDEASFIHLDHFIAVEAVQLAVGKEGALFVFVLKRLACAKETGALECGEIKAQISK